MVLFYIDLSMKLIYSELAFYCHYQKAKYCIIKKYIYTPSFPDLHIAQYFL